MNIACQVVLSLTILFGFFVQPALADQIDGKWCSPEGERIEIAFSDVTTPAGNSVTANYDRHHIDYVIPEGETQEGKIFSADQLNYQQIRVTVIGANNQSLPEIWTKCPPGIS